MTPTERAAIVLAVLLAVWDVEWVGWSGETVEA